MKLRIFDPSSDAQMSCERQAGSFSLGVIPGDSDASFPTKSEAMASSGDTLSSCPASHPRC